MIEWSNSFLIGIDIIDEQHKELFRRVNCFVDAVHCGVDRDKINDMISYMKSYALSHFQEEEDFMESIGYPHRANQERAHDEFVDNHLDHLLNTLDGSKEKVRSTISFFENWLTKHVIEEDKQIGVYFKKLTDGDS